MTLGATPVFNSEKCNI